MKIIYKGSTVFRVKVFIFWSTGTIWNYHSLLIIELFKQKWKFILLNSIQIRYMILSEIAKQDDINLLITINEG